MKRTNLIIVMLMLILIIGLAACNSNMSSSQAGGDIPASVPPESSVREEPPVADNPQQPETTETHEAASQSEPRQDIIKPIELADGLYDIGKTLFPNKDTWFSGRLLDDDRLLVTTLAEAVIYSYQTGEILHRLPTPVERLGMEHFYSQEQIGESEYIITLYDRNLDILAQHKSDRPAIPAIDGKTILYDEYDERRRIITLDTETGEEKEFDYKALEPNAGNPDVGGIWVRAFDGEYVFFCTAYHPEFGNSGVGALNIMTGEGNFYAGFPSSQAPGFPGVPDPYGKNKAIFWQDGSAHGTDGTYFVIMDAVSFSVMFNVGTTACRVSDNGKFLVAVSSEWKADTQQIVLTNISAYHGDTEGIHGAPLQLIHSKDFEAAVTIESDYGSSFSGISISDDGKYICFSGRIEEDGGKRQTLFMYEIK